MVIGKQPADQGCFAGLARSGDDQHGPRGCQLQQSRRDASFDPQASIVRSYRTIGAIAASGVPPIGWGIVLGLPRYGV